MTDYHAKPVKYLARLDGQVIGTRKSPRVYTHAIAIRTDGGSADFAIRQARVVSWCGRLDLAQAEARRRGPLAFIVPAETI